MFDPRDEEREEDYPCEDEERVTMRSTPNSLSSDYGDDWPEDEDDDRDV